MGIGNYWTSIFFPRSSLMPLAFTTWTKNTIPWASKLHFIGLSSKFISCYTIVLVLGAPNVLSMWSYECSHYEQILWQSVQLMLEYFVHYAWECVVTFFRPKSITFHSKRPCLVIMVVLYVFSFAILICQKWD
jgi:hypothetical protein